VTKIVFLDIDGVLNSERLAAENDEKHRARGEHRCECYSLIYQMDRACVERLNRIVRETGALVVISSSWRKLMDLDEIKRVLASFGFAGEVIGETPDLVNDPTWLAKNRWGREHHERIDRGHEIWEWITQHPEVTHFVILDDCTDMAHVKPFHVHTDFEIGLDDPDVERALHLMAKSEGAIVSLAVKAFREDT
jgi:hypothetical protein